MISANAMHGPDRDDMRYHQVRDAMRGAYKHLDEKTPAFASAAAKIYDDLKRTRHEWAGEKRIETEVWEYCKSQESFTSKGYQLNLNRFMGVVEKLSRS